MLPFITANNLWIEIGKTYATKDYIILCGIEKAFCSRSKVTLICLYVHACKTDEQSILNGTLNTKINWLYQWQSKIFHHYPWEHDIHRSGHSFTTCPGPYEKQCMTVP